MDEYLEFVRNKVKSPPVFGHEPGPLHPMLFDFQAAIVKWAIRRGCAAVFADCGLGKSLMQLEWARQSGDRVLIVAPLAVVGQTIVEGQKIGVEVRKVSRPDDGPGIQITNYEKLEHFVDATFDAIVLDESGILKSLDGKTRTMLIDEFSSIPRRLCCSATPSPNDLTELCNHAQFLGVMSRVEMLATFFVHDSQSSGAAGWRLKGHAQDAFWKWVAKWATYVRSPSDLGFDDAGFKLPPLTIRQETVYAGWKPEGMLFAAGLGGIHDRRKARRGTMDARIAKAAEIIRSDEGQWLVWCGLNDEGDGIEDMLDSPDCVQVAGKDCDEKKESAILWFTGRKCICGEDWFTGKTDGSCVCGQASGKRTLISKARMYGFGINAQTCHNELFLGIGDSFETYYQAIRRCWRFGQRDPVNVVIVVSDAEQTVAENVRQKEQEASEMATNIIVHAKDAMRAEVSGMLAAAGTYNPTKTMKLPDWAKGTTCAR